MFTTRYELGIYVKCVYCAVRTGYLCKVCLLRGTDWIFICNAGYSYSFGNHAALDTKVLSSPVKLSHYSDKLVVFSEIKSPFTFQSDLWPRNSDANQSKAILCSYKWQTHVTACWQTHVTACWQTLDRPRSLESSGTSLWQPSVYKFLPLIKFSPVTSRGRCYWQ